MTPLDRAALAIEISIVERTMHHPASRDLAKLSWLWPHVARAVLQALMEPSPSMREAGASMLFGSGSEDWGDDAAAVWQAMLTAAMEGE